MQSSLDYPNHPDVSVRPIILDLDEVQCDKAQPCTIPGLLSRSVVRDMLRGIGIGASHAQALMRVSQHHTNKSNDSKSVGSDDLQLAAEAFPKIVRHFDGGVVVVDAPDGSMNEAIEASKRVSTILDKSARTLYDILLTANCRLGTASNEKFIRAGLYEAIKRLKNQTAARTTAPAPAGLPFTQDDMSIVTGFDLHPNFKQINTTNARFNPANIHVRHHNAVLEFLEEYKANGTTHEVVFAGDDDTNGVIFYMGKAAQLELGTSRLIGNYGAVPNKEQIDSSTVVYFGILDEKLEELGLTGVTPWGKEVEEDYGIFKLTTDEGRVIILVSNRIDFSYQGYGKKLCYAGEEEGNTKHSAEILASIGVAIEQPDERLTNFQYEINVGKDDEEIEDDTDIEPLSEKTIDEILAIMEERLFFTKQGEIDREASSPKAIMYYEAMLKLRMGQHGAWYTTLQSGLEPEHVASQLRGDNAELEVFSGQTKSGKGEMYESNQYLDGAMRQLSDLVGHRLGDVGKRLADAAKQSVYQICDDWGHVRLNPETGRMEYWNIEIGAFVNLDEVPPSDLTGTMKVEVVDHAGVPVHGSKNRRAVRSEPNQTAVAGEWVSTPTIKRVLGSGDTLLDDQWEEGQRIRKVSLDEYLEALQNYTFIAGNTVKGKSGPKPSPTAGDEFHSGRMFAGATNQNFDIINRAIFKTEAMVRRKKGLPEQEFYLANTGADAEPPSVPEWLSEYSIATDDMNPRELAYMQAARQWRSANGPRPEYDTPYATADRLLSTIFECDVSFEEFVYWRNKLSHTDREALDKKIKSRLHDREVTEAQNDILGDEEDGKI